MLLTASFLQLLHPLRSQMARPSFDSFLGLLTGWVLCARHTVTEMVRAAALVGRQHHTSFPACSPLRAGPQTNWAWASLCSWCPRCRPPSC